jgi:molybdopterin-guanine dinucleotide biosynthesis protein A
MKPYEDIHAFILGGGRSLRTNGDKALFRYRGRRFIDIVIECVSSLFGAYTLVGRRYEHPGLGVLCPDDVQGVGPLGGILTALRRTQSELNFFVGIDYPLIDRDVVSHLADAARQHAASIDGLVPVMPDGRHPLFAFYSRACLPAAEYCIHNRSYRVQCLAGRARILYYDMTAERGDLTMDRLERNFININYHEDYQRLLRGG